MSEPKKLSDKEARVEACALDARKAQEELREATDKLDEAYARHAFEIKALKHTLEFKRIEADRTAIWMAEAQWAKEKTFDGGDDA